MGKFGYVGFNSRYRMFALFRDKVFNIGNRLLPVRIHVVESFGCPFSSCNYVGFCKDCPNKICTQVTY